MARHGEERVEVSQGPGEGDARTQACVALHPIMATPHRGPRQAGVLASCFPGPAAWQGGAWGPERWLWWAGGAGGQPRE